RAQLPTQNPPRVPIQDHRQVPPATATLQVRHVPNPHLTRSRRRHFQDAVGNLSKEPTRPRHAPVDAGRSRLQPRLPHQPSHTLTPHPNLSLPQRRVDPRTAVRPVARLENRPNPNPKTLVLTPMLTHLAPTPGVIPAPRHPVTPTQPLDPKP